MANDLPMMLVMIHKLFLTMAITVPEVSSLTASTERLRQISIQ